MVIFLRLKKEKHTNRLAWAGLGLCALQIESTNAGKELDHVIQTTFALDGQSGQKENWRKDAGL